MSAAADRGAACRGAARALAPCARHQGGLTLSGSSAAALAELFRVLARDDAGDAEVSAVAERAARRIRCEAEAADSRPGPAAAPAPRTPADPSPGVLAAR